MEGNKETIERLVTALGSSLKPMNVFDVPSEDDVLSLNVGGTHLDVSRGTLTCMPGLLSTKFSGEWDHSIVRDATGRFFVDAEPELFLAIVNYLRDFNLMLPSGGYAKPPTFSDPDKQLRFMRLVKSFQLHRALPFQWTKASDTGFSVLEGSIYTKIFHQSCDDESYIVQRRAFDNRCIVSFEAQVHIPEGADLLVGWLNYSLENATNSMIDHNYSISFKLPTGRLQSFVPELSPFPGIYLHSDLPKKTDYKIRCSNRGAEWYLDDVLVDAETKEQSRLLLRLQPCIRTYGGRVSFQLVDVEYEEDE